MAALVARLRPPAWAQDALLAAFVTFFQIRGTILVSGNQAARPLADLHGLGYALLALGGVALVARRRSPVGVFAFLALLNAAYYLLRFPDGPGWTGLFIALYSLVAYGEPDRSLPTAVIAMSGLTAVWLLTAQLRPLNAAGWVFFRIGTAVMAAALGESVRTRRELLAAAVERAARAEHGREAEARQRADAERLRIARDVHDTVAHAIALINVQAGAARHVLDRHPARARDALTTIEATSAQALNELRTTLGVLRTAAAPEQPDSPPALRQIDDIAAVARDAGLHVTVTLPQSLRQLPDTTQKAAYRVVQESLTNVIRHANATRVAVSLGITDGHLHVDIDDDGTGPATAGHGGHGVTGMQERCEVLGGHLTVGPRPDGGFRVQAWLPLPPQQTINR